jgi:dipeptidyl aminopeptidase/acylaminoacyl peptidase
MNALGLMAGCSSASKARRTPTMLILGDADYNCSPEQGEQFYTVLKANGCTVEMLRMPTMSHEGSKSGPPVMRRAQNAALLDWMNRYVLGSEAR